jgi:M6 family metalloprotease-like protein
MKMCRWIAGVFLCTRLLSAQSATDPAVRIRELNRQLIALSVQRDFAAIRARDTIRFRLAAFAELAERDPAGALSLLLPEENLAPLRTLGAAIASGLESEGEWSGPVQVVAEDDFVHHASRIHFSMQAGGERLRVYSTDPANLRTGDTIVASGVRMGRMLLIRTISPVARADAAASACTTTGVQHLAVLMVNFASSSINTSVTNSASLGAIVNGGSHNLTGYWNEASYGLTSAAADVYGPFNLGADYTGSDYNTLLTDTLNAAASTVTFPNYTHIVIVMPDGFPVGGGLGTVGCESFAAPSTFTAGVVWVRADFMIPNDVGVCALAHEDGHNMGLNHASTESYGSVPLGSFGTVPVHNEYGSFFSLMSECFTYNVTTLLGHYDAQHKVALGWWVPSNYQTVTANGSFVLAPTETNTSNLHAIRVQRGVGNNFWLWLEYRQNSGYDSTFSAFNGQIYSGAMIHFEDPTNTTYIGYTRLLNYTAPVNPDFSEPALAVGSTWSDPYSLLTLSVPGADASGLHVTVNYDTPCATLTPASKNYTSSGAVAGDTVIVTAAGTCAWTSTSNASWIAVTGGAKGSGSGTVTYSLTANSTPSTRTGTITIQRQSFTITQASSNPQPTPVSVSPSGSSSVAGASKTFTMTYSDAGGAANLATANVWFSSTVSQVAACSISWVKSNGTIRLADDADNGGYSYWYAAQNGQASNSQCTVTFSNAVATSGNNLTLTLTIQFTAAFAGTKNIYMEATDTLGADSGGVQLGTWTISNSATPALSITKSHSGNFGFGQLGATYSVVVSNAAGAASTTSTVTVTETVLAGLTLVSMAGNGWTCPANGTTCTRTDPLAGGSSYKPIVVTVNVAANANSSVTNQVSVSTTGSATAQASDTATVVALSPCDTNLDGIISVADIQKVVNQVLGGAPAVNDLDQDGKVDVVDIQIVIRAVLGGVCTL